MPIALQILDLLTQNQVAIANADIKINKDSLKSTNFFNSRLQQILSNAINLKESLSGEASTQIENLNNLLQGIDINTPTTKSIDKSKQIMTTST